jgi:hypothetical protein
MVVDLLDVPGRTFRVPPSLVYVVENNLTPLATMACFEATIDARPDLA